MFSYVKQSHESRNREKHGKAQTETKLKVNKVQVNKINKQIPTQNQLNTKTNCI